MKRLVVFIALCVAGCGSDADDARTTDPLSKMSPATARAEFYRELEGGSDCPRLFELRNIGKREAERSDEDKMNVALRSVECFSATSKRKK